MKNLLKNQINVGRVTYPLSIAIVIFLLLSANHVKMPGSPYELMVWELKAGEGYRSWWYPDGWVRGKKAYSIGFGWNDQGRRRRAEISKYTNDGEVDFGEALQISLYEISKYGKLNSDPYKDVALKLYSYNCGITKNGSALGKCCGGRWGCGNSNPSIRKSHNRRRKYELALWNHDVMALQKFTDENREKIKNYIIALKTRGR